MQAVILAGGSGVRLWPLSREELPKQYLSLGNVNRSLFQETVARLRPSIKDKNIIIVTQKSQKAEIRRQLSALDVNPETVTLLLEPQARNTAPAIGLAAWFIARTRGPEALMAVFPCDHLIPSQEQFNDLLNQGRPAAAAYGLVTFGITPHYPETGYGYICRGECLDKNTFLVKQFVEKPRREQAEKYIEDPCFLWNSGMFMFKVKELTAAFRRYLPEIAALLEETACLEGPSLTRAFAKMQSVSIDYGIMEKAEKVVVIPADIDWSDMGSFESYYQIMPKDSHGNYSRGRTFMIETKDSLVYSRSRLVGTVGLEKMIVVDAGDALLVCPRRRAQDVKKLVEVLEKKREPEYLHPPTVNRPWGSFTSLEMGDTYQVKRIRVSPGKRLSLQSHVHRSEHWVVVGGEATVTIGEEKIYLLKGESCFIPTGAKHRLENRGEDLLEVIEIQNGRYLGEDDIIRYEDDFGRVPEDEATPEQHYRRWLDCPELDGDTRNQLREMAGDTERICSCFGCELEFGTGGMRAVIGPGTNRMNRYIVRRTTQGLANYLHRLAPTGDRHRVMIAYDTRQYSPEFAKEVSLVLAANGIEVLLFTSPRPTPELSFGLRREGCAAGIIITASHNPAVYNGYKIYGPDGGQAVSPLIDQLVGEIARVDMFEDVRTTTWEEAAGLIKEIGPEIDRAYLEAVQSLSLSVPQSLLKVIYTPLHGTGACFIPGLLRNNSYIDLAVVEEQMIPDPHFSTVKVPNPEDPATFKLALALARRNEADLVLATDPDGDRVGCAARSLSGDYVHLTGDQIGALLLDYILGRLNDRRELPVNGAMVKTIVTGDLGKKVAEAYGVKTIETLTGFKYIGDKINEFERSGEYQFLFGYEESYGFLAGTFGRDKDAVGASYLLAEMAAYHKGHGKNLLQVLDDLYIKHGYYREELVFVELADMSKAGEFIAAFDQVPTEVAGEKVIEKRDYSQGICWDLLSGQEQAIDLPCSSVFYYRLASGAWFGIRPSGTEPKIKIYFSVNAGSAEEAEAKLKSLKQEVLSWQPQ